ncbi:hypothetical protein TELCIR_20086, partial [Teladorsagia circumcincta]
MVLLQIRHLEHENLNRFIGSRIECSIKTKNLETSLKFLSYKSKNCLVGDHWDVKISDFGLNRVELCDKLIAEEIIYMLKKGGYNAPRPDLLPHETIEVNPAL